MLVTSEYTIRIVVRILPNSLRQNAQLLEQSIVDLDEKIKDVLEETKVDFDKWKAIAAQQPQMSPEFIRGGA
ncbi:unnamed protein product [Caenorhabditis auriculariae]|uniref:Uncharacterized protein n=1 Tax=Caenorhabditis auriculariae TaxID=2777116 RepID=A0A8S1HKI9_9PELO|nr:unnamed protein product [Caenorhabditis auriculariae]